MRYRVCLLMADGAVGRNEVSLVLDARPVWKGDTHQEIVNELLDGVKTLVHVDGVLMGHEFDIQHSRNLSLSGGDLRHAKVNVHQQKD